MPRRSCHLWIGERLCGWKTYKLYYWLKEGINFIMKKLVKKISILLTAILILTSVTVFLGRIGISGVNASYERLIQYGIAFVVVWIATFATGGYKGLRAMSFLDGVYLCFSGLAMGAAWYCLHLAYVYGINASVAMVERFDLVAAVVLGCVFMRERLTIRAIFGMFFMMFGFWLLQADLPIIPL